MLVISQDLDELLAISHRIAVLYGGRLSTPRPADQLSVEEIGLLMAGHDDAQSSKEGRSAAWIRLVPRQESSPTMAYLSPLFALAATVLSGLVLFAILGFPPLDPLFNFFVKPLLGPSGITNLLLKATPLILIAIGLSMGYRANVWNIGAEGQYTIGAVFAGGVALLFYEVDTPLLLPGMIVAGALGGMVWAGIPALLRTRFNTSELLTSLMLVYVATQVLLYLVHGPWKDPDGFSFPETRLFHDAATLPRLWAGTRINLGWPIALLAVFVAWIVMGRTLIGFQIRVSGTAPTAARFAGFSEKGTIWLVLMVGGGLAGVAGMIEVSGTIGQLVPVISPGYGFTAIIVAFLGRPEFRSVYYSPGCSWRCRFLAAKWCRSKTAYRARSAGCSRACCCSSCSRPTS